MNGEVQNFRRNQKQEVKTGLKRKAIDWLVDDSFSFFSP